MTKNLELENARFTEVCYALNESNLDKDTRYWLCDICNILIYYCRKKADRISFYGQVFGACSALERAGIMDHDTVEKIINATAQFEENG